MYFVYVLISKMDSQFYTGFTKDIDIRLKQHNNGEVTSTKNRRPLELVYFEASLDVKDAAHREKYLKTTYGKRYLRNRIKNYIN